MIYGMAWPAFMALFVQVVLTLCSVLWVVFFDRITGHPFWRPIRDLEETKGGE